MEHKNGKLALYCLMLVLALTPEMPNLYTLFVFNFTALLGNFLQFLFRQYLDAMSAAQQTVLNQGWKFMCCSHCQQGSWLLIHKSEQQIRSQVSKLTQLLKMSTTHKFPLQIFRSLSYCIQYQTLWFLLWANVVYLTGYEQANAYLAQHPLVHCILFNRDPDCIMMVMFCIVFLALDHLCQAWSSTIYLDLDHDFASFSFNCGLVLLLITETLVPVLNGTYCNNAAISYFSLTYGFHVNVNLANPMDKILFTLFVATVTAFYLFCYLSKKYFKQKTQGHGFMLCCPRAPERTTNVKVQYNPVSQKVSNFSTSSLDTGQIQVKDQKMQDMASGGINVSKRSSPLFASSWKPKSLPYAVKGFNINEIPVTDIEIHPVGPDICSGREYNLSPCSILSWEPSLKSARMPVKGSTHENLHDQILVSDISIHQRLSDHEVTNITGRKSPSLSGSSLRPSLNSPRSPIRTKLSSPDQILAKNPGSQAETPSSRDLSTSSVPSFTTMPLNSDQINIKDMESDNVSFEERKETPARTPSSWDILTSPMPSVTGEAPLNTGHIKTNDIDSKVNKDSMDNRNQTPAMTPASWDRSSATPIPALPIKCLDSDSCVFDNLNYQSQGMYGKQAGSNLSSPPTPTSWDLSMDSQTEHPIKDYLDSDNTTIRISNPVPREIEVMPVCNGSPGTARRSLDSFNNNHQLQSSCDPDEIAFEPGNCTDLK